MFSNYFIVWLAGDVSHLPDVSVDLVVNTIEGLLSLFSNWSYYNFGS